MEQIEKKENTLSETEELRRDLENDTENTELDDSLDDFLEELDEYIASQDDECETLTEDDDFYDDEEDSEEDEDGSLYDFASDTESLELEVEEQAQEFEESLAFFDDMVGMEHIKQKLLRLGRYALWKKKLEIAGTDTSVFPQPNLTFMFLGDPGTGKTTVAKKMGKILKSIGLIRYDIVNEFRRENLVGQNYGCEEQNTNEALKDSKGCVFFLDEAYQCFKQSTDPRDPGYHILETMMPHFGQPERCIIMAGYKNEMMELFKVNPGFRSRIPEDNIIEFTKPSEQMLVDVATNAFRKMTLNVTKDADAMLRQHIHGLWLRKDKDFGNARVIRQLAESVVINHANRIMGGADSDDFTINEADVRQSLSQQQIKAPTRTRIGFV